MSNENIKIVTRTCITCQHEPDWKAWSPDDAETVGYCKSQDFCSPSRKPQLKKLGQICRNVVNDGLIEDCPAWECKVK